MPVVLFIIVVEDYHTLVRCVSTWIDVSMDANVEFGIAEPVVQDISAPGQHIAWIQVQDLPTFPHPYTQPAPSLYCYKYRQRRVLCVWILLNPWGKIGTEARISGW